MTIYVDKVFAPLDDDLHLERVGGGNETEVYSSDDHRYVIKLKSDFGGNVEEVLAMAQSARTAAEEFADSLGPEHTIPSYYVLSRDSHDEVQLLVVQPFVKEAEPLYAIEYAQLSQHERDQISLQLREIIRRALLFYRRTGKMPDLYGRSSTSSAERQRLNTPWMLPWRLWSFLVQRNLLRSHNLLLKHDPTQRIVLVDYDPVRRGRLYRMVYYAIRWMLFWRDHLVILLMRRGGLGR